MGATRALHSNRFRSRSESRKGSKFLFSISTVFICAFFLVQIRIAGVLNQHHSYYYPEPERRLLPFIVSSGRNDTKEEYYGGRKYDGEKCSHQQTRLRRVKPEIVAEKIDGFFNSNPIHHQKYDDGWHSTVHCIGDNFSPDAWKYKSCHFKNLCFDLKNQSFVLFTSPEQRALENVFNSTNLKSFSASSSYNTTVSLGGINPKWNEDAERLRWFPQLRSVEEVKDSGYYVFSSDVVFVPFHSLAGYNPGHLVWDDFLPIYNLLSMFHLLEKNLVLMRYKLKLELTLWAGCDSNNSQTLQCKTMLKKFLPLMGQQFETMTTQENVNMKLKAGVMESNYVCSKDGAAGLGMLTDHGKKLHGWVKKDYEFMQNLGRGTLLYDFRKWTMENINIKPEKSIAKPPYKVVFSISSSNSGRRSINFKEHMKQLSDRLSMKYPMEIVSHKLSSMSLEEQIELVSGAAIMVTMNGGGKFCVALNGVFHCLSSNS